MDHALNEKDLALCDEQGFLFERSIDLELNSATFIRRFMNSALALSLDGEEEDVYAFSLKELYAIVNASYGPIQAGFAGKHYPKEALYWIGYLYRYWALYRYRSSKSLYRLFPGSVLFSAYGSYHTMDPKTAIENLEQDYLSKHPEAQEKEEAYTPISAELSKLRSESEANRIAIDFLVQTEK